MQKMCNKLGAIAALLALAWFGTTLTGCTCGFDCSSDENESIQPVSMTLLFSDSLPDELEQVVLSVDRIEFVRDDGAATEVDLFSISRLALENEDTFEVDLLTLSGESPLTVISELEIPPDFYERINIYTSDAALDRSFVIDDQGLRRTLTVTNDVLSLSGRQFNSGNQEFVIEFGLPQAIRFVGESAGYRLTTDGLRLQNTATAANLTGSIDADLLDVAGDCDDKNDPLAFNRVYIYEGEGLEATSLADVYTADSDTPPPANASAPFAVATLEPAPSSDRPLNYFFSYLPTGNYTLALACNAEDDDPVDYDAIAIPEPGSQVYSLALPTAGETYICNLAPERDCELE